MTTRKLGSPSLALLVAAAVVGVPAPAPVTAQSGKAAETQAPDERTETYGSWTLRCGAEASSCHVFQALFRTEDGAQLVRVTLFADENGQMLLRVLAPLGADLAAGVPLGVDEGAIAMLPFRSCWPHGCIAETALTSDIEAELRGGEVLSASVVGADTGQTVRFEFALNGLARALERMRE